MSEAGQPRHSRVLSRIVPWGVTAISVATSLFVLDAYLGTAVAAFLSIKTATFVVALTMTMGWLRDVVAYVMEYEGHLDAEPPKSFLLPATAWGAFMIFTAM